MRDYLLAEAWHTPHHNLQLVQFMVMCWVDLPLPFPRLLHKHHSNVLKKILHHFSFSYRERRIGRRNYLETQSFYFGKNTSNKNRTYTTCLKSARWQMILVVGNKICHVRYTLHAYSSSVKHQAKQLFWECWFIRCKVPIFTQNIPKTHWNTRKVCFILPSTVGQLFWCPYTFFL